MKSKNWSQYGVAITVVGCSLVLLAALTLAIAGPRWGTHGRKLEVEFKDATGIKLHLPVRYAGAVAGTVVAIRYLTPAEREQSARPEYAVRVTARLNKNTPLVPSDVKATISAETILGEKFVALSAGTPGVPPLADGAIIEGQSLASFDNLAVTLEETAGTANELLRKFNVDYPDLRTNLTRLLVTGETLLSTTTNLVNDARTAISNVSHTLHQVDVTLAAIGPEASNLLVKASSVATNLNGTLDNTRLITADLQQFLTNEFLVNLDQNMRTLTNVLANTEKTMAVAKILVTRLAEKPSRLIWQMRTNPVPSEEELRYIWPDPPPPNTKK